MPGHRLADGAVAAPHGSGRALCVGLSDTAQAGREIPRRPQRHRGGLHRPARLVRGLSARCRLGGPGPDLGPDGRRRPYSAGLHAPAVWRRTGRRRRGQVRGELQPPHGCDAAARIPARHQTVYRRAVGGGDGPGRRGGRRTPGRRRAPDDGRRTHFCRYQRP